MKFDYRSRESVFRVDNEKREPKKSGDHHEGNHEATRLAENPSRKGSCNDLDLIEIQGPRQPTQPDTPVLPDSCERVT